MAGLVGMFFLAGMACSTILFFYYVFQTANRLTQLQPFRAFASRPMRQLTWESSMFSGVPAIIFAQARHRIRFSNLGKRHLGRYLMECALPIQSFVEEPVFLEFHTRDFDPNDLTVCKEQLYAVDFPIEDEVFAKRFIATSTDPTLAAKYFDARIQLAFRQLDELFKEKGGAFFITSKWVVVRKVCSVKNATSLEHLFQVAGDLFDAVLDRLGGPPLLDGTPDSRRIGYRPKERAMEVAGPDDIALLPASTEESTNAMCQLCGAEIEGDIVWCAECSTPHHRDCWQYNGQCTIYGCPSKRFVERKGQSK